MKQLILSVLGGTVALVASANSGPVYFTADFAGGSAVPAEWIQQGVDATPTGSLSSFFGGYSADNCFKIKETADGPMAFSPSEFSGGATSDEWLITPEITIEDEVALLVYTVNVEGNSTKNRYKVFLSETGTAKEDFTKSLISTTITGKGTTTATHSRRLPIEGYKGKKVHLAFVNCENTSGMLGFGGINVGQYYLVYDEAQIEHHVVTDAHYKPAFTIKLSTPMLAEGVSAVLSCDNGFTSTYSDTYAFSSSLASSHTIEFPDEVMMDRSKVYFTLTITPNFEGARPTVLEGAFIKSPYNAIAVMEEYTGTWCPNCTRGIAFMNYYKDKFGRHEGKGGFIGVGIHYNDPMQPPFYYQIQSVIPTNEFPTGFLNRKDKSDPTKLDVKGIVDKKSIGEVRISRVDYVDNKLKVNFAHTLCYDSEDTRFRALAYVIENNVKGSSADYTQMNTYGSNDAAFIAYNYGEELVPYFEPFINRTVSAVPYTEMVYQEVGRSVYPDVNGRLVSGPVKTCVYNQNTFEFDMPSNVLKKENVEVAVIFLDAVTGEVVLGDVLGYDDFNKDVFVVTEDPIYPEGFYPNAPNVSVEEVAVKSSLSINGDMVSVNAEEAGRLLVYQADGTLLENVAVEAGFSTFRLTGTGLLIIRLETPNGSRSVKVMK